MSPSAVSLLIEPVFVCLEELIAVQNASPTYKPIISSPMEKMLSFLNGSESGTRTRTPFQAQVLETCVSAISPPRHLVTLLGFEPRPSPSKGGVLPLDYRVMSKSAVLPFTLWGSLVTPQGFKPRFPKSESGVLPLHHGVVWWLERDSNPQVSDS